jgi:ketosteroid isomerase-like protein
MSEESTTPDLVGLVRRLFDALNRRDVDAATSFYAPDGVFDTGGFGMGTFKGREATRGFLADWFGAYEEFEIKLVEVLDLGSGVVFDLWLQHARPVDSGGDVQMRGAGVSVWTEGVLARRTLYADPNEARAAAERLAEERE